jgi:drug/metabolite transporter (DMT)-like permease
MPTHEQPTAQLSSLPVPGLRIYLALVAGVIIISFTAILTKWADAPGPVSAGYRMVVSALVLAIPFMRKVRRWDADSRSHVGWGMLGGLWFALNLGFLNSALLLTSATSATLLDNTAPIWVGLGAMVVFRERLPLKYWLGGGVALIGVAVVTGFLSAPGFVLNQGDLLALVGSAFFAGYLLTTQRARRGLDPLSYLWLVVATAAVALLGASLALGMPLVGYPPRMYWALIAQGVICQAGGWLLINYVLGHLAASTAVIVLLAQPVVTGLLSIPLLGESLAGRQVSGGALVLVGIYLSLRRNNGFTGAQISKWVSAFAGRWKLNGSSQE